MTQTTTIPIPFPAVSGTIGPATVLLTAELIKALPVGLPTLLSTALNRKAPLPGTLTLDILYDYAHGNQIGAGGQYWKGRKAADGTLNDVLPQLVQDDQLGPAMGREVDSQFGKDPEWDAVQNGEALPAENEMVVAMTAWHQEAGLTNAARDAARHRWWSGRMVGRVYIPEEYAEQLLKKTPSTLADALEYIHVEAVDPRNGGPLIDAHGRTLGYWNRYVQQDIEAKDVTFVELHTAKITYRFRQETSGQLTELTDQQADSPFAGEASQRRPTYLMWHADRDGGSSITLSIRDMQDRLNVVSTYMGRNDEQTGYRQFIVSNAEAPTTPDGKPAAYQMGPGVVVNLKGLTMDAVKQTPDARPQRHTPTWEVVDPLNPEEYHIPSINQWTHRLLDKLDQAWTLDPETQVSGESKRQSRKPFDKRVAFAGQDMGGFIAWALRAALMLASMLMGKSEYQDITFTPKLFLDIDAVNLEELRVKLLMWQAGGLSLTALLEATPGVADVGQEESRIQEQQAANPAATAREDALKALLDGGGTSGNSG